MKILLLLIVFLFITNTACWNLNDIYKQLVDGIKNDKKDNRNYEKRTGKICSKNSNPVQLLR